MPAAQQIPSLVRTLVVGHGQEVLGLWRRHGRREAAQYLLEGCCGLLLLVQAEVGVTLSDPQLGHEFCRWQVAVPVVEVETFAVEHAQVRSPSLPVAGHHLLGALVLGVHLACNEALGHHRNHHLVRVRHGTHSLATASGG